MYMSALACIDENNINVCCCKCGLKIEPGIQILGFSGPYHLGCYLARMIEVEAYLSPFIKCKK